MSSSAPISSHLPPDPSRGSQPQKRALSDSEDADEKEIKRPRISDVEQQVAAQGKQREDKKRRKKKKRKTSVVLADANASAVVVPPVTSPRSPSSSVAPARAPSTIPSTSRFTPHVASTSQPTAGPSRARKHIHNAKGETLVPPSMDKGKGKASTIARSEHRAPLVRVDLSEINRQLASKNELISKHEALLGTFTQSLTCQICLELMYKPYALAPCGHSACHGCLVNWFKAPPSGDDTMEQTPAILLKKTCPLCRAVVKERPTEIWGIKDMVAALVKSKFAEPHPDPLVAVGNSTPNADPWAGIFKKVVPTANNTYVHQREPPPIAAMQRMLGMRDEEDGGIYRCLDCHHEILNGVCTNCERAYPGHTYEMWSDEDNWSEASEESVMSEASEGEESVMSEASEESVMSDLSSRSNSSDRPPNEDDYLAARALATLFGIHNFPNALVPTNLLPHAQSGNVAGGGGAGVDRGGNEDDGSYEGSFIDDSDVHHLHPGALPVPNGDNSVEHLGSHGSTATDDEVEVTGVGRADGQRANGALHSTRSHAIVISDDEDGSPEVVAGPSRARALRPEFHAIMRFAVARMLRDNRGASARPAE